MEHFDVAVAGGGPAGSATAITLARAGWRVLLADLRPSNRFRVGEALPPSSTSLLTDLGLLGQFLADAHRPSYGNVSAWGSSDLQVTDFIHNVAGHGFQLDRARFDDMLKRSAQEAGVAVHDGLQAHLMTSLRPGAHSLRLGLGQQSVDVSCQWLVDAGGRAATLSRRLGAIRTQEDRLVAFSVLLCASTDGDEDGRTWVEAVSDGWWYSALLPSGKRLVTFLSDRDLVDQRMLLSPDGMQAKLDDCKHLGALCRLHGYLPQGRPQGSNASSSRLDRMTGDRWLAVGDAALALDPLSSQGISNAIYSGMRTGQALGAALKGDEGAINRHTQHLEAIYDAYLAHRRGVYAAERRWRDAPFWRRRQGGPASRVDAAN